MYAREDFPHGGLQGRFVAWSRFVPSGNPSGPLTAREPGAFFSLMESRDLTSSPPPASSSPPPPTRGVGHLLRWFLVPLVAFPVFFVVFTGLSVGNLLLDQEVLKPTIGLPAPGSAGAVAKMIAETVLIGGVAAFLMVRVAGRLAPSAGNRAALTFAAFGGLFGLYQLVAAFTDLAVGSLWLAIGLILGSALGLGGRRVQARRERRALR